MPTLEFTTALGRLAANHLWQSTGFAAVAVLLALALRANHARARYWLWLAASVKFLFPFSVLATIGASLGPWFIPATPVSRLPFVFDEVVQPFAPIPDMGLAAVHSAPGPVRVAALPVLLLALWFCGFVAVLLYGWVRWRRVAAAVRSSTPLTEGRELEAWRSTQRRGGMESCPTGIVSSSAKLEPGVFGIFRPILWLPAGIGDRLEDAELEAILAHELCHIRRRDNLLSAIHMLVESLFWFHPLVWWLGARLEEERERACDEEVVQTGGEPQIYAESILKVCEFYLASPVACAAGVTGGELKKRIEGIMTNRFTRRLSYGKRILLTTAAIVVIAGPIAVGLMNPPNGRAQSQESASQLPSFEVASIKPTPPSDLGLPGGAGGGPGSTNPGQFIWTNAFLRDLILAAYDVPERQAKGVLGLPAQAGERYNLVAKVPRGATRDQLRPMLQRLLAERFGMIAHWEQKEVPSYRLIVARGGSRLREPEIPLTPADDPAQHPIPGFQWPRDKDGWPAFPPGIPRINLFGRKGDAMVHVTARMQTIGDLLQILSPLFDRPVVDETGLAGRYDFTLTFLPSDNSLSTSAPPASSSGQGGVSEGPNEPPPDIFAALASQLGLRLVSSKSSNRVLVIDKVNTKPTDN